MNRRETVILITLLLPMIVIGISANFLLVFIHVPVKVLLFSVVAVATLHFIVTSAEPSIFQVPP